ncbi:hypothetical protein [Leptolyngbya sp. NIES-2104]|uniref:hypothetical protein n=1 Tax=Leptolyngbya sp. NIES-2104 TaxID=1552121 RepID=UPI0006EC7A64|nr:hypothetical protein [Leptolyngbya sp. NIES-2104]GAP98967.1 hypothetical protein NIES2104_55240 [Leptolyngbya sp. NIES-2104]
MRALIFGMLLLASPAYAAELDLDPKIIQNSPVLQRWQKQVPNVTEEIKTDPSFRPRIRVGYSASELKVGIEDLRIDRTNFTTSATYQSSNWGADLHYYVRPLGSYLNVAPVVGYRHLNTEGQTIDGANIGIRALFVLSRGGGADISLTQSWVAPFSADETGLTTLSIGYALTHNLRISTEFQRQNSPIQKESRIGIGLEWMP